MNTELITNINQSLKIEIPASVSQEELREKLALHINHLINTDFEKLVFYLYRIDVDEIKMRNLLEHREGENAAELIADLIIERQIQKRKSREENKLNNNIPDNERW